MDEATVALTVMSGLIGISFLGFLIWGIRSGQFHNIEEAKYQLFRSHPDEQVEKKEDGGEDKGGGQP